MPLNKTTIPICKNDFKCPICGSVEFREIEPVNVVTSVHSEKGDTENDETFVESVGTTEEDIIFGYECCGCTVTFQDWVMFSAQNSKGDTGVCQAT